MGFFWFYTQKHIHTVFPPSQDGIYVVIVLMRYLAKTSKLLPGTTPSANYSCQILLLDPTTEKEVPLEPLPEDRKVSYVSQSPGPRTVPGRGGELNKHLLNR